METTYKKSFKKVHIGDDVWGCGKVNENYQDTRKKHMVIYGPNNTQHHIYDKDVIFLTTIIEPDVYNGILYGSENRTGYCNKQGNYAIESKLKIFILTSILDNPKNWCFDLSIIPKNGKLKVIYNNGTVKNIEFNGMFVDEEIPYKWSKGKQSKKTVPAFGYRKSNLPIR